jgi:hypothetical protein
VTETRTCCRSPTPASSCSAPATTATEPRTGGPRLGAALCSQRYRRLLTTVPRLDGASRQQLRTRRPRAACDTRRVPAQGLAACRRFGGADTPDGTEVRLKLAQPAVQRRCNA